MSLVYRRVPPPALRRLVVRAVALTIAMAACSERKLITPPPDLIEIEAISIDAGVRVLERGTRDTLTATVLDADGDTVDVPVTWRSTNEDVARFNRGGVLIALKAGTTAVVASSLGIDSDPVPFAVVWVGPAAIDSGAFAPPNARGPGVALTDSVRVIVTNTAGLRVANARVAFTVSEGGGSVSPATDSTDANGVAATQWTLGPVAGRNTVTASVIKSDGAPDTLVVDNLVTYVINSYNALTVQAGDNQSALLLADVATNPSVRLVDSLGSPRAGVPVTFTASTNGRVTSPIVSTGVDGVASPGKWTLGEVPGPQSLVARVEDARVILSATATGTPVFYTPTTVTAGGFTTCALETGGVVKCWGAELQIGTGDTTDISTPKQVQGPLVAASVVAGQSHNCALTSANAMWCWGVLALVDTTKPVGASHELLPKQLMSDITWSQVSPGASHNCGIDLLQNAYCWGVNTSASAGQLGDGTATDRRVPTLVTGGFKFSQISAGEHHTCGLTSGAAFCWGLNASGQLGDGTTQHRLSPTAVGGGLTFESIVAGANYTCALTPQPAGQVYCWGSISGASQVTPTSFPGAPALVSLTGGSGHACGLSADATAYCWGLNNFGQVGDSSQINRNTPTRVAGGLHFTKLSARFFHTCGITTAGAVACWGSNQSFALGDSTATLRTMPRHVILGVTP